MLVIHEYEYSGKCYSFIMNIFMNTLNLAQKGHFEVTFARSSVKTGSPVCKTPLLQVVIAHNLLTYLHVELFGKKDEFWG